MSFKVRSQEDRDNNETLSKIIFQHRSAAFYIIDKNDELFLKFLQEMDI